MPLSPRPDIGPYTGGAAAPAVLLHRLLTVHHTLYHRDTGNCTNCLRSFHVEYTRSRPITEVKQHRARLVLGWVTAWEYRVSKA